MATLGLWPTLSLTCARPARPVASVTRAVIVCVPGWRRATVMLAPVPRVPSRLDVHWIWPERSPLSASVALPVKVTGAPMLTVAFGAGAAMLTTGAVFWASVRTSCGLPAVDSRVRYVTQSVELLTSAKLYVPSPVTAAVASKSTTCLVRTFPLVERTAPSTAGRGLFGGAGSVPGPVLGVRSGSARARAGGLPH